MVINQQNGVKTMSRFIEVHRCETKDRVFIAVDNIQMICESNNPEHSLIVFNNHHTCSNGKMICEESYDKLISYLNLLSIT